MRIQYLLPLALLAASTAAHATGVEFALSEESAQITLFTDSSAVGYGGVDFEGGLFFNEDDDFVGHLGFMVEGGPRSEQPFSFGLGARGYWAEIDTPDADAQSLAIGIGGKYHFPGSMPMSLGADVFYGPDITTGGDADSLTDARLRFAIEVVPGTSGFVGYRWFELSPDGAGDDYELDENVHLGIRVVF